ncbi:MAG: hypothetical protein MUC54_05790 [Chloroflexi bacterium]|jgi:hypothetical protein|nr:hypothetical protein [Chloroflexota bacterium]
MDPYVIAFGTGLVGLGLFVWLLCAYVAYRRAPERGRRALTWGILGIIFGPFALFALALLPRGGLPGGERDSDPRAALYEVPKEKRR